ncbi:MAG: regulatory protein RecX [Rikenellaceae bacterium]
MWGKRIDKPRTKTAEQALSSLMALCARGERSSGDAYRLMTQWGVDREEQEAVVQRLIEERFIDNSRYAKAFVRDKMAFNGWGERKIAMELSRKGVSREIIERELAEIDSEQSNEQLRRILTAKMGSVKYKDRRDLQGKLIRFAISRGYSTGVVYGVVNQIIGEIEEEW